MRKERKRVANTPRVERIERPGGEPLCSMAALWVGKQAAPENVSRCGSSMGRFASAARNSRDGQNIALGHSREPPVSNRWSCHLIKRLPSRPWGMRRRFVVSAFQNPSAVGLLLPFPRFSSLRSYSKSYTTTFAKSGPHCFTNSRCWG